MVNSIKCLLKMKVNSYYNIAIINLLIGYLIHYISESQGGGVVFPKVKLIII